MIRRTLPLAAILLGALSPATLLAQDSQNDEAVSAEAIAEKLANPNASVGQMSFPLDYIAYDGDVPGAGSQSSWRLSFQPSLPYSLGEGVNLFVRPLIPIILDQPVPVVGDQVITTAASNFDDVGVELGDIGFDVGVGKSFTNGMVLVGGVVGTLPTATDDAVGLDQYLLGPEFLMAKVGSWGAAGLLVTHQWDVAGEDSFDTSITGGQYFFTYNLGNAWQISMSPTFSYNHEAESGNRLALPVGVGVAKTMIFGGTPWKFSLQYWHYVESPDAFGPDFQIRFTATPVVPLPW